MTTDAPTALPDPALARRQATLRIATGVTGAFVLCELLQWWPSFMAAVLTVVLLANLPMRPPLKTGVALLVTMSAAAVSAYGMAALLRGKPFVLFGLIGLCVFLCLHGMVTGRPRLPALLLLICLATIPVVVMVAPDQASVLPLALVRGVALALLSIWLVYLIWPQPLLPASAAPAGAALAGSPLAVALLSTAVVMPLMAAYLLFGLADALPVLVTTVMLVVNFDPRRSGLHALALVAGNFAGGVLGFLMHSLLLTAPTLPFLAVLLFLVMLGFAHRIVGGGTGAAVALIGCNAMLIILSAAITSGPGSLSIWLTRLFQFALAGAYAIGLMNLLWLYFVSPNQPATARPGH